MRRKTTNSFEDSPQVIRPILTKDKEKRDIKMSYDLEFEKLIIMLKNQYHSLFEKRKLKLINRQNQNYHNEDSDSDTESDSENEQEVVSNYNISL